MELKLRIEFSELNINVNILSALDAVFLSQVEDLANQLAASKTELNTVLQQSQSKGAPNAQS